MAPVMSTLLTQHGSIEYFVLELWLRFGRSTPCRYDVALLFCFVFRGGRRVSISGPPESRHILRLRCVFVLLSLPFVLLYYC